MDVLWAPWRLEYILSPKPDECIFCLPDHTNEDEERLVLFRAEHCFVVLNKYPYTCGHLMVTPYRHATCLTDLTAPERHELMDMAGQCTSILKQHFNPQGINLGLNLGEAAGAGIREHLHIHLVPRWNGDSSFMAAFSEVRVIPEHLHSTYERLKPLFNRLGSR